VESQAFQSSSFRIVEFAFIVTRSISSRCFPWYSCRKGVPKFFCCHFDV